MEIVQNESEDNKSKGVTDRIGYIVAQEPSPLGDNEIKVEHENE